MVLQSGLEDGWLLILDTAVSLTQLLRCSTILQAVQDDWDRSIGDEDNGNEDNGEEDDGNEDDGTRTARDRGSGGQQQHVIWQ